MVITNSTIDITNLNPQYVWGGDAFTFSGTSKIWVDHCTVSLTVQTNRRITNGPRPLSSVDSTTSLVATRALPSPSPITISTVARSGPLDVTAITTGPLKWSVKEIRSPSKVCSLPTPRFRALLILSRQPHRAHSRPWPSPLRNHVPPCRQQRLA